MSKTFAWCLKITINNLTVQIEEEYRPFQGRYSTMKTLGCIHFPEPQSPHTYQGFPRMVARSVSPENPRLENYSAGQTRLSRY